MKTWRLACCGLLAICMALGTGARRLGAGERGPRQPRPAPPAPPRDKPPAPKNLVPVTIRDVGLDPVLQAPVVILETAKKDRVLLVVIGHAEALAILRQLHHAEPPPRPMTHDLLNSIIISLGGKLSRVVITRLANNTFYGELVVQHGKRAVRIDTRPSDAMALALRAGAPIFVAREVLDEAGLAPGQLPKGLEPEKKPRRPRLIDPERAI